MSGSDVILLPDSLLFQKFIEFTSSFLGLLIITLYLALLSILFQKSEEIENLVVGRNVDDPVLRRLPYEILSALIVWVIFRKVLFNLLHHLEEIIEVDSFEILPFFVHLGVSNLTEKLFRFIGIPLQTDHNLFKIFDVNCAVTLLVK